jgi:hypothetical protein
MAVDCAVLGTVVLARARAGAGARGRGMAFVKRCNRILTLCQKRPRSHARLAVVSIVM